MPELPEVETICKGLAPHLIGRTITRAIIREYRLRWPILQKLPKILLQQSIIGISRRGKYILIQMAQGTLMIHLGMSGRVRIIQPTLALQAHDHVDIILDNQTALRFTDPRRFGSIHWIDSHTDPYEHRLLINLGPEPLTTALSGDYLWQRAQKRKTAIKAFIMDSHIVVGVGNIYANEALFLAQIKPTRAAGDVSRTEFNTLVKMIRKVLLTAIKAGGTTLKDFVSHEGMPGYFQQKLKVYGRGGEACVVCKQPLIEIRLGQRSTVYCGRCQR